jgi:hypothetical protein
MLSSMRSILLVILLGLVSGCSEKLETGYIPRKLNSNENDRRAYYASRFSPEATVEKKEGQPPPQAPRWR